jgi:hypothetical protein
MLLALDAFRPCAGLLDSVAAMTMTLLANIRPGTPFRVAPMPAPLCAQSPPIKSHSLILTGIGTVSRRGCNRPETDMVGDGRPIITRLVTSDLRPLQIIPDRCITQVNDWFPQDGWVIDQSLLTLDLGLTAGDDVGLAADDRSNHAEIREVARTFCIRSGGCAPIRRVRIQV